MISRSFAPIALRMPISRVRSFTLTSMMFMMPMPPTSSEMKAMTKQEDLVRLLRILRRLQLIRLVGHLPVRAARSSCGAGRERVVDLVDRIVHALRAPGLDGDRVNSVPGARGPCRSPAVSVSDIGERNVRLIVQRAGPVPPLTSITPTTWKASCRLAPSARADHCSGRGRWRCSHRGRSPAVAGHILIRDQVASATL